jgi:hypothetical protein
MVLLPQLVGDGLETMDEIAQISLVQGVVPDRILGRVNATLGVFSHWNYFRANPTSWDSLRSCVPPWGARERWTSLDIPLRNGF